MKKNKKKENMDQDDTLQMPHIEQQVTMLAVSSALAVTRSATVTGLEGKRDKEGKEENVKVNKTVETRVTCGSG